MKTNALRFSQPIGNQPVTTDWFPIKTFKKDQNKFFIVIGFGYFYPITKQ